MMSPSDKSTSVFGEGTCASRSMRARRPRSESRVRSRISADSARASPSSCLRQVATSSSLRNPAHSRSMRLSDDPLVVAFEAQDFGDPDVVRADVLLVATPTTRSSRRWTSAWLDGEIDARTGAGDRVERHPVGAVEPADESLRGVDGELPRAGADVSLVDGDCDQPSAGGTGVRAVVERHGRRLVGMPRDRDELRRGDAARLAVNREREVGGGEIAQWPAGLVDDADVDRHDVDRGFERRRRLGRLLRRRQWQRARGPSRPPALMSSSSLRSRPGSSSLRARWMRTPSARLTHARDERPPPWT